jgi:hypothetical protein
MKPHFLAAAVLSLGVNSAGVNSLKPFEARRIDLGPIVGVAYYTVQSDGVHVVATLAHDETDTHPLRVQAVLGAGQGVTFSTPGDRDTAPMSVRIERFEDGVVVRSGNSAD